MTTKTSNHDIPMAPGSEILRARLQRTESVPTRESDLGEDSATWGGYTAEATWDNEDYDDPRHEMSLAQVAKLDPGLKVVRYQNQDPEQEEILALVKSPMFREVEFFDPKRNFRAPGDAEWAEIVASGALSHIRFLGLDSCYQVADETIRAIAAGAMPKLEALEIGSTDVTDEGLMALADASKTPALQVVQGMFMTKLSEEGIAALAAARPDLTLRFTQA